MPSDFQIECEPTGTEVVARILRRAWLALDGDASAARREIQRALELLSGAPVQTEVLPGHVLDTGHALAPWQVRRVIDYIHANLEAPIPVEDIAGVTRLSTSYFFRAFKRSFDMSPHAYVIVLRLARARAMLAGGDEQISQIAAACGFADQAHFSRVFRRKVGCAPGIWRREHRGLLLAGRTTAVDDVAGQEAWARVAHAPREAEGRTAVPASPGRA